MPCSCARLLCSLAVPSHGALSLKRAAPHAALYFGVLAVPSHGALSLKPVPGVRRLYRVNPCSPLTRGSIPETDKAVVIIPITSSIFATSKPFSWLSAHRPGERLYSNISDKPCCTQMDICIKSRHICESNLALFKHKDKLFILQKCSFHASHKLLYTDLRRM
jgi:hypothetical protein